MVDCSLRVCEYERDLPRFEQMSSDISEIKEALAVGSERFKNMQAWEERLTRLTITVESMAVVVGVLSKIVFGGCAVILLAVLGALVAKVVTG